MERIVSSLSNHQVDTLTWPTHGKLRFYFDATRSCLPKSAILGNEMVIVSENKSWTARQLSHRERSEWLSSRCFSLFLAARNRISRSIRVPRMKFDLHPSNPTHFSARAFFTVSWKERRGHYRSVLLVKQSDESKYELPFRSRVELSAKTIAFNTFRIAREGQLVRWHEEFLLKEILITSCQPDIRHGCSDRYLPSFASISIHSGRDVVVVVDVYWSWLRNVDDFLFSFHLGSWLFISHEQLWTIIVSFSI